MAGFAEPEDECCEVESGPVAGGEFVEAGRDGPELLEPAEAAFDDVAGLLELTVQADGLPLARPRRIRLALLIGPFRDHRPDAPAPQSPVTNTPCPR